MSPEPCSMFHWIGQAFTSCDRCGWPAWDHSGLAVPEDDTPFGGGFKLRPWDPGEAEAIRGKWEGAVVLYERLR